MRGLRMQMRSARFAGFAGVVAERENRAHGVTGLR